MSRKRKTKIINLITFFLILIISIPIYAKWEIRITNPKNKIENQNKIIGKWYMPKPGEPQIIVLNKNDKEQMDNFTAPAGTIVYYIDENGNAKVYTTRRAIGKNDKFKFPDTDSTSKWFSMSYDDNSIDYSGRQRYVSGDLVVFKGKLYEYRNGGFGHDPNTEREVNPEENPKVWFLRDDLLEENEIEDIWFRYKIYFEGDIVFFKGKYYKALKSGYYNQEPRNLVNIINRTYWEEVTK